MFSGKIVVDILSASNLPTSSENLNPYVLIRVDSLEGCKTATAEEASNPVWNEKKVI